MPETKTVQIPLTGEHVTPQGAPTQAPQPERVSGFVNGQYQPPSKRVSLHNTRLGAALAERAEANASAAASQQSQAEALGREIAALRTATAALAANRLDNTPRGYDAPERRDEALDKLRLHNQYGSGPYAEDGGGQSQHGGPNPEEFDFWDPESTQEYRRLNNDHIERMVQQRLEAEQEARRDEAEWNALLAEAGALRAKFGRDANYGEIVDMALKDCAASVTAKQPYSLTESYKRISGEVEARSGRRRSSYLPADCKTLGQIMKYNQETGRSGRR